MANKLPYFRWHPKDFDTDENVRLMSMCEVGLYVMCLNHSWINGSLPGDVRKIAKIVGQPLAQVKKSWQAVSKCFQENEPGSLTNSKQEKERKWAMERSIKCKEAVDLREQRKPSIKALREPFSNGEDLEKDDDPYAGAGASGSVSESDSLTQPTYQRNTITRAREDSAEFETLLQHWNRHRGFKKPPKHIRQRGRYSWSKSGLPEDQLDLALDGFFQSSWARKEGYPFFAFVKDPQSWIADGEDAVEPAGAEPCAPLAPSTNTPVGEVSSPLRAIAPATPVEVEEWNRDVPECPCAWDPEHSKIKPLIEARMKSYFQDRFPEMCRIASSIHRARGAEVGWLTFTWLLGKDKEGMDNAWKLLSMGWMGVPQSRSGHVNKSMQVGEALLAERKKARAEREAKQNAAK